MTTKTRTTRRPQPIEESKIQGYSMIFRRDAAFAITNKLTGSQCRLWLYLMLIYPFADRTAGGEIKYHDLPPIPANRYSIRLIPLVSISILLTASLQSLFLCEYYLQIYWRASIKHLPVLLGVL